MQHSVDEPHQRFLYSYDKTSRRYFNDIGASARAVNAQFEKGRQSSTRSRWRPGDCHLDGASPAHCLWVSQQSRRFGFCFPPILLVVSHGWLGVNLFFMLSGFLITGILLGSRERPHYFRNFYIRRVLRIMPLYFACVIVWSIFYKGYGPYFLLSSVFGANMRWPLHIRVPHGPGGLWSLAIEEQFYLVWPLIVFFC